MKKHKTDNFVEAQYLVKTLEEEFSNEKCEKLDKLIRELIDDNLKKRFRIKDTYEKLDTNFEYNWTIKRIIKSFYELTKKSDTKFYLTRTFRAYVRLTLFADLEENKEIQFMDNLEKYLSSVNEKYLLINARVATEAINATRLKRYKFYSKVKKILKEYATDYDLLPYEDYIVNKKTMEKDTFLNFIKELNRLKIKEGIIPYEICEYLICQMIEVNSPISIDHKYWASLRECIFCDFISNIQEMRYHTKDYLNYVMNLDSENINGRYRRGEKIICMDESIIYSFSNDYIRAIVTAFHELRHFGQFYFSKKHNYHDGKYRILKEEIVCSKISKLKEKYYRVLFKEIDARKYGMLDAIHFIEEAGVDITKLKLYKDMSLVDFETWTLEDCEKSLCDNFLKLNIQKRLTQILRTNCNLLDKNPILRYEYNEDGTRKKANDIITGLEKAYIAKEISRETLVDILNYSIFDEEYITKNKTTDKNIIKYNFISNSFKRICIKTLSEKLQVAISRIQYYTDNEKTISAKQCLEEQVLAINNIRCSITIDVKQK